MTDKVAACPDCDCSYIEVRQRKNSSTLTMNDPKYYCPECKHRFDEPNMRERKKQGRKPDTGSGGLKGLAGRLHELGADDV